MRKGRFTDEQIIRILKESEAGTATREVCRKHGITPNTFYAWRKEFGGKVMLGKRALRPGRKRELVTLACRKTGISERRSCVLADVHRLTHRYVGHARDDTALRRRAPRSRGAPSSFSTSERST